MIASIENTNLTIVRFDELMLNMLSKLAEDQNQLEKSIINTMREKNTILSTIVMPNIVDHSRAIANIRIILSSKKTNPVEHQIARTTSGTRNNADKIL